MSTNFISYIKILRNPNLSNDERLAAVKKLETEKDTNAVPSLIEIINNDNDEWSQCMSANILGEIGDPRAVEPLVMYIKKTSPMQRFDGSYSWSSYDESFFKSLGKLGDPGFDALVGILRERKDGRRSVILSSVLFDNFKSRAYDPAVEALDDSNEHVRGWACRVLGWIGDKRALPILIKALQDTTIRSTAAIALGDLNNSDAIAPLQELLTSSSTEDSKYISKILEKLKESQGKSLNATY